MAVLRLPLRRLLRRPVLATTSLLTALALVGFGLVSLSHPQPAAAAPRLRVSKVVGNLKIPWDVTWVGSTMLFDQRAGGVWSKRGSASPRRVKMVGMPRIYVRGEAGMLGIVADPRAASNRHFYTCMAVARSGGSAQDVQVWKWRLVNPTRATKVNVLIKGIPLATDGRHSGCRLRFRSTTSLYVGTGDATGYRNPQSLSSLGGKVLRVRSDGYVWRSNPFYRRGGKARYVWSYGHRNVQGVMRRPNGEIWTAEHGPTRDDEVNRIFSGDNYGWRPGPGYNESRPMTFSGAHGPKWRSGSPTVATSGGTFISGSRWGSWNGDLAVAMLKGQGVKVFSINRSNRISGSETVFTRYGRIRTIQQGPDGALYLLTSNGTNDSIYRVTPR